MKKVLLLVLLIMTLVSALMLGTTAVASVRLKRGCVGIELDLHHVEIAARRADREIIEIWLRHFRVRLNPFNHADHHRDRGKQPSDDDERTETGKNTAKKPTSLLQAVHRSPDRRDRPHEKNDCCRDVWFS